LQNLMLIRHGEAGHHVAGMTGGWTDLPLTARGREDAARTAGFLATQAPFAPRFLLSSDLARARETAEIIGAGIGLAPELSGGLRELNNGIARGRTVAEAAALELPRTESGLDWIPYPEAESWRKMYDRVSAFYSGLRERGCNDCVVVSHGNAMICLINAFLGLTTDENLRDLMYTIRPCSITHLSLEPDGVRRVVRLNDVSHLI
jgi:probable phosphoglycerate mutase